MSNNLRGDPFLLFFWGFKVDDFVWGGGGQDTKNTDNF
jgi:hypothetical protein